MNAIYLKIIKLIKTGLTNVIFKYEILNTLEEKRMEPFVI